MLAMDISSTRRLQKDQTKLASSVQTKADIFFFVYLIAAAAALVSVTASPVNTTESSLLERSGTPSSTGNSNGWYYSWHVVTTKSYSTVY